MLEGGIGAGCEIAPPSKEKTIRDLPDAGSAGGEPQCPVLQAAARARTVKTSKAGHRFPLLLEEQQVGFTTKGLNPSSKLQE